MPLLTRRAHSVVALPRPHKFDQSVVLSLAILEKLSRIFFELKNAALCIEEASEVEKREDEEKERKKRKEHMKIIKQVETGGEIKPTPQSRPQSPPDEHKNTETESLQKEKQTSDQATVDEKNREKRASGENKADIKREEKPSPEERKEAEGGKKKDKERKRSLTKEAAENIINAIKGTSSDKELKKANSKEKDLKYGLLSLSHSEAR